MTRDVRLARRARRHGARFAWRIVREARRAKLPISVAFALVEQESNFRNVYGHDPVSNRAPKGGRVTRGNYCDVYRPDRRAGRGMQGVGPAQLTWWEFQDRADRYGGCWKPKYNLRVAFETLAGLVRSHGSYMGFVRYNGDGPAAHAYARELIAKRNRWHNRLGNP